MTEVEPEQMPLAERCTQEGIRMVATPTYRPTPAWAKGMHGWRCTLYRTPQVRGNTVRSLTIHFWMGPAVTEKPTMTDLMDCLISDAAIVEEHEQSGGAGSFAADMGYENVREAEQVYTALRGQTERLRRFLGEAYQRFVYETERL